MRPNSDTRLRVAPGGPTFRQQQGRDEVAGEREEGGDAEEPTAHPRERRVEEQDAQQAGGAHPVQRRNVGDLAPCLGHSSLPTRDSLHAFPVAGNGSGRASARLRGGRLGLLDPERLRAWVPPEYLEGMAPGEERVVNIRIEGVPGLVTAIPGNDRITVRRMIDQAGLPGEPP